MFKLRFVLALAMTTFGLQLPAQAQNSLQDLVGEYDLLSSTTVPASKWGYAKGRISIRQLDERHVLILTACGWKREPKSVCDDRQFAQFRDGGFYLQDVNTDWVRLYFDPVRRRLTMISRGADAKGSVRHEIFGATDAALVDSDLVRRMKRAIKYAEQDANVRSSNHYSKHTYLNNRIEFQHR